MDYQQIVWLASYPKSGNTWVRCFLDAYFLGEVDINELVLSVSDDSATRHLVGDNSDPRLFPVQIQMLTRPMALLRMVRQYHEYKVAGVPLFVKTHNAHMVANGIETLPDCLTKATVCLVRDPRDVVVSFSKHMGLSIDEGIDYFLDKYRVLEAHEANKMADFICSWPSHVLSYANADTHNVLMVRYEDLKVNPQKWFAAILSHAGIAPDLEKINRALALTELRQLQKQEKEKGFRESSPHAKDKFFGEGRVKGWKEKLNPKQLFRIEKGCASVIKRFYKEKSKGAA